MVVVGMRAVEVEGIAVMDDGQLGGGYLLGWGMEKMMGVGEYTLACIWWKDDLMTDCCSEHGSCGRTSWAARRRPLAGNGRMVSPPGSEGAAVHAAISWLVSVGCHEEVVQGRQSGCGLVLLGCLPGLQTTLWPGIGAGGRTPGGSWGGGWRAGVISGVAGLWRIGCQRELRLP